MAVVLVAVFVVVGFLPFGRAFWNGFEDAGSVGDRFDDVIELSLEEVGGGMHGDPSGSGISGWEMGVDLFERGGAKLLDFGWGGLELFGELANWSEWDGAAVVEEFFSVFRQQGLVVFRVGDNFVESGHGGHAEPPFVVFEPLDEFVEVGLDFVGVAQSEAHDGAVGAPP